MNDHPKPAVVYPPQAEWNGLPGWPLLDMSLLLSRALTGYPSQLEAHAVFLSTRVAAMQGIHIPGLLGSP